MNDKLVGFQGTDKREKSSSAVGVNFRAVFSYSRVWWRSLLVETRDVLSYASVTSVPSSVEFTRVLFLDTAGVVFLCCGDCVSRARGCADTACDKAQENIKCPFILAELLKFSGQHVNRGVLLQ